MRFGIWEIVLILVVILVLFGGSRLAGVGKSLGRGIKEFKEEVGIKENKEAEINNDDESKENAVKDGVTQENTEEIKTNKDKTE
ncbi:MAG: twin-arginine translocase TatA/TatE family subunit [Clostridiales bacterium]